MTKQRIALISLIAIIVFGSLLGGELVYKKVWINDALSQESMQVHGISSAKMKSIDGKTELMVQTNLIDDLQKVSLQLQQIAGVNPIRLVDHRTPELVDLFQSMQFPIQEGIANGNFSHMEASLKELAAKAGVDLKLNMDNSAIYLTLTKEEGQLVAVVERQDRGAFLPSVGIDEASSLIRSK
jgi:hypothetical protein